jgi:hypothetical protein
LFPASAGQARGQFIGHAAQLKVVVFLEVIKVEPNLLGLQIKTIISQPIVFKNRS